jgi:hypothetical protein
VRRIDSRSEQEALVEINLMGAKKVAVLEQRYK